MPLATREAKSFVDSVLRTIATASSANIVSPERHRKCPSGLNPKDESCHIEDGYDGLAVADLPTPHHPQHLRQRLRHHLDELVGLAGVRPGSEVRGPEQM